MKLAGLALCCCCCSPTVADQPSPAYPRPINIAPAYPRPINIAVIGAGAAGASAAYYASQYAQNASLPVSITVFERNEYVGGRSTTVSAYGEPAHPVELGASIFVQANRLLWEAVHTFNLSTSSLAQTRRAIRSNGAPLAVWDGSQIILTQTGGWWDYAKLFWRYGSAPIKAMRLMRRTVDHFLDLYEPPVFPFFNLARAAQQVGLLALTAATGEQYLAENGITGRFAREIVQASTRVNYAQNIPFIHGLETMVCLAAEGAVAVQGGNWQIFQAMMDASGAHVHLGANVTAIGLRADGRYELNVTRADSFSSSDRTRMEQKPDTDRSSGISSSTDQTFERTNVFDSVVLAAPYQFSGLKSLGLQPTDSFQSAEPDEVPYVELHVTLFTSPHRLSPTFFNLAPHQAVPQVILTTVPEGEPAQSGAAGVGRPGFFSISLLREITNPDTSAPEFLYKIFSPSPPNSTFLAHLLGLQQSLLHRLDEQDDRALRLSGQITWLYRKKWHSYPYEYPRVTFEEARLGQQLWYTGGMDSFVSTMETNALMGKNVAGLLVREWAATKREGEFISGDGHAEEMEEIDGVSGEKKQEL